MIWFSFRHWNLSSRRWFVWQRFYLKGYIWTPFIYVLRRRRYAHD
jgi:hypothetical protein